MWTEKCEVEIGDQICWTAFDFLENVAPLATGKIPFLVLRYTAQLCMRKCRLEDLQGKFKGFSIGLRHSST